MEKLIETLKAEGLGGTPNSWGGVDIVRGDERMVRVCREDGQLTVHLMSGWNCSGTITFSGTSKIEPAAIAAIRALVAG